MEHITINEVIKILVEDDWVDFEAYKLANAKVMWIDKSEFTEEFPYVKEVNQAFIDKYAYAIANNKSFSKVLFDKNDKKTFKAERYGGDGIGNNGGGARAGTDNLFQLKGIGANCLSGRGSDHLHSYGGLDAPAAIIEIINSNLFEKLLPLGTVKIKGLIFVGHEAGYDVTKDKNCVGVLIVRERCLRPAHILRVEDFQPREEYSSNAINDAARIRRINKKLFSSFKTPDQFTLWLVKFLQNQANQFGFSRAARILNGTITHSNCTLDGRWIDLNSSSMVNSGVNYCIRSQFYREHEAPLAYALEMLHNFNKYNDLKASSESLIYFYYNIFYQYFQHYVGFILGFPNNYTNSPKNTEEWKYIADCFYKVIHLGKKPVTDRAKFNIGDPVYRLIKLLYISLYDAKSVEVVLSEELQGLDINKLVMSFSAELPNIHNYTKDRHELPINNFVVSCFIKAIKKSCYSSIFYLPLLESEVRAFCEMEFIDKTSDFIESYVSTIEWVFEDNWDELIMFKNQHITVKFFSKTMTYSVCDSKFPESYLTSYQKLIDHLSEYSEDKMQILGFNGLHFFELLKDFMFVFEKFVVREWI